MRKTKLQSKRENHVIIIDIRFVNTPAYPGCGKIQVIMQSTCCYRLTRYVFFLTMRILSECFTIIKIKETFIPLKSKNERDYRVGDRDGNS